ncbi:MAG: hypothetical protein ACI9SF_000561 [Candidatus Nanohaloarchaea archaeon]|jgi:hypothetical protein
MNQLSPEDVDETMEALEYGVNEGYLQPNHRRANNDPDNSESESEIFEIMEGARTGEPVQDGPGHGREPEFVGKYNFTDSQVYLDIHILGGKPFPDGSVKEDYTAFLNTSMPEVPAFDLNYEDRNYEEIELGDSSEPLVMSPPLSKNIIEEAAEAAAYIDEIHREAEELAEQGEQILKKEAKSVAEELGGKTEGVEFEFRNL